MEKEIAKYKKKEKKKLNTVTSYDSCKDKTALYVADLLNEDKSKNINPDVIQNEHLTNPTRWRSSRINNKRSKESSKNKKLGSNKLYKTTRQREVSGKMKRNLEKKEEVKNIKLV